MDGGFFRVTVTGEETLSNELNDRTNDMRGPIRDGLMNVQSEMVENLQKHIREDWYNPWGEPKYYTRRTDNPAFGTPLGDISNMDATVKDMSLSFVYSPNGRHENNRWHKRDGDKLIEVIQTNSGWTKGWEPDKDRRGRAIMPRPFWNRFVEEQFDGMAFAAFEYGFSGRGFDLIREGGERDVLFQHGESLLDATDDYIDLPY